MAEHAGLIREAAAGLDALVKSGDPALAEASGWIELRPRVEAVLAADVTDTAKINEISPLIRDVRARLQSVSEVSGLLLDPGADSFALILAGLFEMPKGVEALASGRRAMDRIVGGETSPAVYMTLAKDVGVAQLRLDVSGHYLIDNFGTPEHADSKIPPKAKELKARLDKAFESMDAAHISVASRETAKQLSTEVELLTEELTALRGEIDVKLNAAADRACLCREVQGRRGSRRRAVVRRVGVLHPDRGDSLHCAEAARRPIEVFGKLAEGKFDDHIGRAAHGRAWRLR